MKTHLIINIHSKCILMLLILTLGGWGKAWGQTSWPFGYSFSTNTTITLTNDYWIGQVITISGGTVTIKDDGTQRKLKRTAAYDNGRLFEVDGGTLIIEGTGADKIIIDGYADHGGANQYQSMAFQVGLNRNSLLTLKNTKITNFYYSAGDYGVINNSTYGSTTCTNCNFDGRNESSSNGSVVFSIGTLTCTNCQFNGNGGPGTTRIVYARNTNKAISLSGCTFTNNEGIPICLEYILSNVSITNCAFSGNNGDCGGISITDCTSVSISSNTTPKKQFYNNISSNVLYQGGGGIYSKNSTVEVINMDLLSNQALGYNFSGTNTGGQGGGIYIDGGSMTITNCNFTDNTATTSGLLVSYGIIDGGGSIYSDNATVSLNNCNITGSSGYYGGGIYMETTTFNCTDCEFKGNKAIDNGGGAIHCNNAECEVNCTRCVFQGNTGGSGGALYKTTGTGTVTDKNTTFQDCTFIGNTATATGGGAIYHGSKNCNLTLIDCTITGNTATTGHSGGVYFSRTSTITDLNLSGKVVIKDNSASTFGPNLCLYSNQTNFVVDINPAGLSPLSCGSSIGVTVYYLNASYPFESPLQFANGTASNCKSAYSNHYFFCDGVRFRTGTSGSYTYPLESGDVYYSNQSPYSGTDLYVVPTGRANSWYNYADAAGCTVSGDFVTHVNTAAGLAYLAKDIASGKNYSGKTVLLTADLNMAGHNWEPIGSQCSERAFCGTFNGQGHSITGLSTTLLLDNVGLFGTVGSGGTVKNVVVASSTISSSSAVNLGGIAGEVDGGSVYNCISAVTLSGGSGTNTGALVGKVTSGSLLNSFAISDDAACGSGTATNCYVRKVSGGTANNMGTATNVGASGNTTGAFTETVTPYLYKHADNKVGSTALLTLLNAWVDAQSSPTDLAHWTRTMASPINGDYPLLMLPGTKCVGTKSGNANVLNYGSSFNTMLGTHNASGDNIYFWGTEGSTSTPISNGNTNANVYFAENAAIIHNSSIANAHVGITLDNTNGSAGVHWHMFSPALSNAPLGLNYTDNTDWPFSTGHPSGMPYYLFNQKSEANATYGYFPSHTYNTSYPSSNTASYDYYSDWDYYCYYEPEYHWINFKRNGNAHHHEDLDHPHINYQATPSATVNQNETTLVPGKGYLVATAQPTLLEAKGTLNQGLVTMPVTKLAGWRTGYNLIGNPYQSYLDFDAFAAYNSSGHDNRTLWSGNSVSNASYVILDKDGYSTHAYNSSSNSFGASRYLHPHQGFMIVLEGSGSNAYFDNSMRTTTSTNATFRDDDHVDYPLVNLIATEADGNRDITTIELGRPDRGGAFKQYDLRLGKGCLYTRYEDQDYAIAFTQPGVDHVGIRFETDEDATYTLTWDMENGEFNYLHLIDNITGSDIDCLQAREYRFTATPDDYKSRFKLVFEYTGIDEPEGDGPSTGSGTFAFIMGNELVVNGPSTGSGAALLQMFDMTGRMVMEKNVSGTQTTVCLPEMTAGVYVLKLSDRSGSRVQKIIIK